MAADGGIFAFDVPFFGSTGGQPLNQPVVGMAPTRTGGGYWLVARDGGVFAFDAPFFGSGVGVLAPGDAIVGMAAHPSGRGYWLASRDGRVLGFGDAPPLGGAEGSNRPIAGIAARATGTGYWLAALREPPPPPPPPPPVEEPPPPPPSRSCHPSYPDFCVPPPPPDLDCADFSQSNFTVVGSDPHGLDGDNDGVGCED